MKRELLVILTTSLVLAFLLSPFKISANAESVEILTVTPTTNEGQVGDEVHVRGTIETENGLYRIWFADLKVSEANAAGHTVDSRFSIPHISKGNHSIILQDVSSNINATDWFHVNVTYYIEAAKPKKKPGVGGNNSSATSVSVNTS